ncbi:hypothetical protein DFH05DRAFT_1456247 [Lentinula detonsa]|uniref:Uncharacterized protein n=1 Tax=Lentinula detonsa TaxID=2804962 RepID=A0A9W8U3T5_9AGAR|nr:hypothetical protein DFH05DRAFT_1456247 [Lentinula detonsa]
MEDELANEAREVKPLALASRTVHAGQDSRDGCHATRFVVYLDVLFSVVGLGYTIIDPIAPPKYLPPHVAQFLLKALELSAAIVSTLWSTLCLDIWDLVSMRLLKATGLARDEETRREDA